MRKVLYLGAALFGLAGCMSGMEVSRAPATAVQIGRVGSERIAGTQQLVIRAYQKDDTGKAVELANASCSLSSKEFRAKAVAPQAVVYPRFLQASRFENRGKPSTLVVTCRAGEKTGRRKVEAFPINLTPPSPGPVVTSQPNGTPITTTTSPLFSKKLASSYPWYYGNTISVIVE